MKTKVTILLATGLMIAGLTANAGPTLRLWPPGPKTPRPPQTETVTRFVNTTDFVAYLTIDGQAFEIAPHETLTIPGTFGRWHNVVIRVFGRKAAWMARLCVQAGDTVIIQPKDMIPAGG